MPLCQFYRRVGLSPSHRGWRCLLIEGGLAAPGKPYRVRSSNSEATLLRGRLRLLAPVLAVISVLAAGLFSAAPVSAAVVTPARAPAPACVSSFAAEVVVLQPENRVKGISAAASTRIGPSTSDTADRVWVFALFLRFSASGVTVYVNGDPVNLVDPNGHMAACDAGGGCGNGSDYDRTNGGCGPTACGGEGVSSQSGSVQTGNGGSGTAQKGCEHDPNCRGGYDFSAPLPPEAQPFDPSTYPYDVESGYAGSDPSISGFGIPADRGRGQVVINIFIQGSQVCVGPGGTLCLHADGRGFDPNASPLSNRAFIDLDYNTGQGYLVVNPTCTGPGVSGCQSAWPIAQTSDRVHRIIDENYFDVSSSSDGTVTVNVSLVNASYLVAFSPTIDDTFNIKPMKSSQGPTVDVTGSGDQFPSVEAYQYLAGSAFNLGQYPQVDPSYLVTLPWNQRNYGP